MRRSNGRRGLIHLQVSDKNDNIGTPPELYKDLDDLYHFDFDPCPLEKPEWDGLEVEWGKSNFVNPPFSDIASWLKKAVEELKKGKSTGFLIPVRSHTKYWFKYVYPYAKKIQFLERGLKFEGYKSPFPIPLVFIWFQGEAKERERKRKREEGEVFLPRTKLRLQTFSLNLSNATDSEDSGDTEEEKQEISEPRTQPG